MESSSSTQLVSVDPGTLLVDLNIRKDVRLDKDFVASIAELGVLVRQPHLAIFGVSP